MENKLTYIDLFSGAGGFSLGFDNKGFQNIFSIDIEPSFCETYKHNFSNHRLIEKIASSVPAKIAETSPSLIIKMNQNV